ncbi:hypothetical protein [Allochromatium vinosum]|uniref:hypothetical protein n=1 Tax=Allochromatium vinosum TaxID=1049 RepID=UPI0019051D6A|nr:hypothetical protein [Allochromatium vinosum]MBK1653360.1 hypothetical protein [Allochromatium vinosum]
MNRLQHQLDALERLLLADDLTEREYLLVTTLAALFRDTRMATIADSLFKGNAGMARQFAGLLAMHLNRPQGGSQQ